MGVVRLGEQRRAPLEPPADSLLDNYRSLTSVVITSRSWIGTLIGDWDWTCSPKTAGTNFSSSIRGVLGTHRRRRRSARRINRSGFLGWMTLACSIWRGRPVCLKAVLIRCAKGGCRRYGMGGPSSVRGELCGPDGRWQQLERCSRMPRFRFRATMAVAVERASAVRGCFCEENNCELAFHEENDHAMKKMSQPPLGYIA